MSLLSIGVCDVVADLFIKIVYMWVRGGKRAESVFFDNESLSDFSEVWYYVKDTTMADVITSRRLITIISLKWNASMYVLNFLGFFCTDLFSKYFL